MENSLFNNDDMDLSNGPIYLSQCLNDIIIYSDVYFKLAFDAWAQENHICDFSMGEINEDTYILFKEKAHADAFNNWFPTLGLSDTIYKHPINIFDINKILNESSSVNLTQIKWCFSKSSIGSINSEIHVEENYDVYFWIFKNSSDEKGERIFYDKSRSCFWFEKSDIAAQFKLTFGESNIHDNEVKGTQSSSSHSHTFTTTNYANMYDLFKKGYVVEDKWIKDMAKLWNTDDSK